MRGLKRAPYEREGGQSVVEMALCFPIFILFVLALLSFGLMFHHQLVISHAAREGAREGAVGATDAEIGTIIRNQCVGLNRTNLSWTITPPEGSLDRDLDHTLVIEVQYNDRVPIPILNIFIGNKTLRARSQVLIEMYPRRL